MTSDLPIDIPEPTNTQVSEVEAKIDEIVFRCFAQGQYIGKELDKGYEPDNPIDRTEANKLVATLLVAEKDRLIDELISKLPEYDYKSSKTAMPSEAIGFDEAVTLVRSLLLEYREATDDDSK